MSVPRPLATAFQPMSCRNDSASGSRKQEIALIGTQLSNRGPLDGQGIAAGNAIEVDQDGVGIDLLKEKIAERMDTGHTGKIDDILAGLIVEHTICTIAVGEHERVDAGASSQKIAALATAQDVVSLIALDDIGTAQA